jgi:transposase InsO family protein
MPWRMEKPMDQRVKLISCWLEEESGITELAAEYGVSRKTVYKWINRYREEGVRGLEERSCEAHHHPNMTEPSIIERILDYKKKHRKWGPKKIIYNLKEMYPEETWPSASTAGEWLKKNGLVSNRKKRKHVQRYQDHFIACEAPNDVWSADYKGQFHTKDHRLCYPLTVSDNFSRYLLGCHGLEGPRYQETKACFEMIFREYGLPLAIRTDNGTPFAGTGIGGLSRLSIWWIKLGIIPERIAPARPQQNSRHERMHRTLKDSTANPASGNLIAQQKRFDFFRVEFNTERPHEGIGMKRPVEIYRKSDRPYPNRIKPVEYPDKFLVRRVKKSGVIKLFGNEYFVSELLNGEQIGLKEIMDGILQIYLGYYKLGFIDLHKRKVIRKIYEV